MVNRLSELSVNFACQNAVLVFGERKITFWAVVPEAAVDEDGDAF